MHVTTKGQVTIPFEIRQRFGITPNCEVEFEEEDNRIYIMKKRNDKHRSSKFQKFRGIATVKMSTDEIMAFTRNA